MALIHQYGVILLCIIAITIRIVDGNQKADATNEILGILDDPDRYNNGVPPFNETGPLNVKVQVYLRNIEVDDEKMKTEVEMTFRMHWTDPRLSYRTNVPSVNIVDTHKAWLPDAFLKNSAETMMMEFVHPEAYLRVFPEGQVIYSTRVRATMRCPMDLQRFPHDSQSCPILIASYGFTDNDIRFHMDKPELGSNAFSLARFHLSSVEVDTCDSTTSTGTYSCVRVNVLLKRVFSTYLCEWYIPVISLVIIAFFSEMIPTSALLPRLVLTVTPLITLLSCNLAYSWKLPPLAYTRAFDIYCGISYITIFLTLLHTLIAYYRTLVQIGENKDSGNKENDAVIAIPINEEKVEEDEELALKAMNLIQRLKYKGMKRFDFLARSVIFGFYGTFLFFYFIAYST